MRLHRCAEVGCRELIKLGFDYCDQHYKKRVNHFVEYKQEQDSLMSKTLRGQYDKQQHAKEYNEQVRPTLGHDFYTDKRWETLSLHIKQSRAYQDEVTGRVYGSNDVIVDHIIPRRLCTPEQLYDPDNLMVLSRSTHNTKTSLEQKMNDNQLKHCSKEWWLKVLRQKVL